MRVLLVLADTDRTDSAVAAVELHRDLQEFGAEVRTVALGPGRTGGLDHLVPILAPATRSLAAVSQLRREQRWADVVLCFGLVVASIQRATLQRRATSTAIVLSGEFIEVENATRMVQWAMGAAVLVCTDDATAASVDARWATSRLDFGIHFEPLESLVARRTSARLMLEVAVQGPVLWWVGLAKQIPPALRDAAASRGWPLLVIGNDDEELVVAASDVAVIPCGDQRGGSRNIVRAASTGHAVIACCDTAGRCSLDPRFDACVATLDAGAAMSPQAAAEAAHEWDVVLDEVADSRGRADMAVAAHQVVQVHFAPERTTARWMELISDIADHS